MKLRQLTFALACITTGCTSTTSVATTTEPVTTASSVALPQAITFAFTGDVLSHTPLINQAKRTAIANSTTELQLDYDFRPMFLDIKPLISGVDIAVCHLETPIAPEGQKLSTFPLFGVPKEITTPLPMPDSIAALLQATTPTTEAMTASMPPSTHFKTPV